jgi:putative ABC transport system permease protein
MFKNYLKIILRNIRKHKGYSLINIAGLAVGMTCCILIMLWVLDELSFDRYHEKADRIYRLTYSEEIGGVNYDYALPSFAAAPAFASELPEIESYTRLWQRTGLIKYGDRSFDESNIFYADKDFFRIFSFPLIEGDPDTALVEPGSLILTRDSAQKIFGDRNPLGETLNLNADGDLIVTGIVENTPRNSHFHFNYLVSINTVQGRRAEMLENWLLISGWSYILLDRNSKATGVAEKLIPLTDKYVGAKAKEIGQKMFFHLQPLTSIHLKSHLDGEIEANGDIRYVYIFTLIAIFILIIACINFMNLSTARSAKRGKEVGLRKVLGAHKNRLVFQFLTESIGFSLLALSLALYTVWMVLPAFNKITGKNIHISSLTDPAVLLGLFLLMVFTGFAAGSYPAFYLSSFQPIETIRQKLQSRFRKSNFRNALVILQFSISIILIISTFIVLKQLNFMKNQNLGFKKDQILAINLKSQSIRDRMEAFKTELKKSASIEEVSFSNGIPGETGAILSINVEGQPEDVTHSFEFIFCDHDFLKTYEIELAAGRDFSREFGTDEEGSFLINQAAAAKLGWGNEAVGKKIGFSSDGLKPVLGVIRDFHYRSLKQTIGPLGILLSPKQTGTISIKMNTEDISRTLAFVEGIYQNFEKERSFEHFFVDEKFDRLYNSEERLSKIITFFSFIAIFVACLGLFGLASYTAEQSRKEIGIRKVLGASATSIVIRLSRDFLKWVLVSNLIAWPVTYFIMKNYWLENFSFRTSMSLIMFFGPGFLAAVIALLTVSFQSLKAALADPVKSLRYE